MIVFDLNCARGHRFEGWFASADDFDAQKARGLLSCPSCGGDRIERALSAPRLNLGAPAPQAQPQPPQKTPDMEGKDAFSVAQMLYSRMLDEVLSATEDVGSAFPEEARRIYYKEATGRPIRGQATQAEHDALVEEGVPVARIPLPPTDRWN